MSDERLERGARISNRLMAVIWLSALLLTAVVNVAVDNQTAVTLSGMLLLTFFPGFLMSRTLLGGRDTDLISRVMLSVGLSLMLNCLGYLLLCYTLDRVTRPAVIALISFYGILFSLMRPVKSRGGRFSFPAHFRWDLLALLVVVLGALFRFLYLGYSEYQGDEAGNCLSNSLELLRGNASVILNPVVTSHPRPPTQVLMPAMTCLLTGTLREGVIRFPFALAGVASLWFIYIIGREVFEQPQGGCAACLLAALNGYLLAFSRVVQYQSVVILCLTLSLLFLWRFMKAERPGRSRAYLFLAVSFFSFSVLSHFEGLLFLPVPLFALLTKAVQTEWKDSLLNMVLACLLFLALTGLYYLPLFVNPGSVEAVAAHWQGRHDASLHFHIGLFLSSIPFYTSNIYLIGIILLAVFAAFNRNRAGTGMVTIWLLSFFLYYMVVSLKPRTHVYTFFPPLAILAGVGFQTALDALSRLKFRMRILHGLALCTLAASMAVLSLLTGNHLYKVFINHDPEYVWSRERHEIPSKLIYGCPYRRGWRTVGVLFRTGEFQGEYHSNETKKIPGYYLRQSRVRKEKAEYLIKTIRPISWKRDYPIPPQFRLKVRILKEDGPSILIYQKGYAHEDVMDYPVGALEDLFFRLDKRS